MAWYDITYACGHTDREQLYGKHTSRESYVAWAAENKDCSDCYRAKRKAQGPKVSARGNGESVELLISNSYDQKELLKDRGYRFSAWTPADAPLGVRFTSVGIRFAEVKGWSIQFSDAGKLATELDWIDAHGWPIEVIDSILSGLFQSVGEGRKSLLDTLSDRLAKKQTLATEVIR